MYRQIKSWVSFFFIFYCPKLFFTNLLPLNNYFVKEKRGSLFYKERMMGAVHCQFPLFYKISVLVAWPLFIYIKDSNLSVSFLKIYSSSPHPDSTISSSLYLFTNQHINPHLSKALFPSIMPSACFISCGIQ